MADLAVFQNYQGTQPFLETVQTDPSVGTWTPPTGYAARVRWIYGVYQDNGAPPHLQVAAVLLPNADLEIGNGGVNVEARWSGVNGGIVRMLWSTEVGEQSVVPADGGAGFVSMNYNPLPLMMLDQTGRWSVGFTNGDRLQPDTAQVELFQVERITAAGGNADLYLLPALG
jgi:hypothetical protein